MNHVKQENAALKARVAELESQNNALNQTNHRLQQDLDECDKNRIQVLKDCHILKAQLDKLSS